ncbi:DUF5696 domain-containing protein [Paenibacillus sp. OV219]|uniref:DUF5696 domain-containing protein n=1 Tax=Paenibacillus sp. OV219 TaxID=1884377 RepID=UPI0008B83FAD|nr:DUF5696 domain-containing protein [Paenibacillus sp. OV219]SEM57775.1 hypothetical protein SAMN05518847_101208 [Paenibacillus sp. OV219]
MSTNKKRIVWVAASAMAAFGLYQFAYGATVEPQATLGQSKIVLNKKEGAFPYRSNNYTMPELAAGAIASRTIPAEYKKIGESNGLELYMASKSLAIMVKNKATGYVWSSMPGDADLANADLNDEWQTAIKSPLLLEYYTADEMLSNGSYLSLGGKVDKVEPIEQGMRVNITLAAIKAGLSLEVKLDGDSLTIKIPQSSMWEKGAEKLASIQPYPFIGAVHKADIPGYIFIPDRSGALIRFSKAHIQFDDPYVGKIYGTDYSSDSMDSATGRSSVPVFGVVHGTKQNGVLGIVEDGRYNAKIVAYPSGLSTDFYWVSPKFEIRYGYFQPTSKSMGGYNTFQKDPLKTDRQVRYEFLGGEDADYIGMAKTYRSYLQNKGELTKEKKEKSNADIPLQLRLLGGETEASTFGAQVVPMTTFAQSKTIVDRLVKDGITNMKTVLDGWNKGGWNGKRPAEFPVESKLGGASGLKEFQKYLASKNIPLYLTNNYSIAFENSDLLNLRSDAVRALNNEINEFPYFGWGSDSFFDDIMARNISPGKALKLAKDDTESMRKLGVDGLALDWTGTVLNSDYNKKHPFTREQSANTYRELAGNFKKSVKELAMYQANDYMWKYADTMFGVDNGSSQFMYETDTVPFIQTVMHGYIDYFANPSNSSSSPREDTLRMIDYGQYPSYLLTYEPYWKLRDTPSIDLLTTQYTDLEQPLTEMYKAMNQALRQVQDATIEAREVPDYGISAVKYSNGVKIVVNYTSNDYSLGGVNVKAKSFVIIGGE